jgi:predicted ester cyclase
MTMDAERNKAVIQRFLDAWNRHEADALEEFVLPSVVRHCPATPHVTVSNLDELKEFLRQDTAIFPDSVQAIEHSVAEGDLVATWATYEGTQRGPIGPYAPNGAKAKFDFAAVFRMENGRIAEWWVTWDNLSILRALGHVPSA